MPELERKAIWGIMVGQEGKSNIPIFKTYSDEGFDPKNHLLQSYGEGWTSASFLPRERQLFGLPGGVLNDWKLETNIEGLYAAGDQLFAADCNGHAAATGYYAGRHAAEYVANAVESVIDYQQVNIEKARIYSLMNRNNGLKWKEFNMHVTRIMQNYCGEIKSDNLLHIGLKQLEDMEHNEAPWHSALFHIIPGGCNCPADIAVMHPTRPNRN